MDQVLGQLKWQGVLDYMDDTIVYAKTEDELVKRTRRVLGTFREAGLQLNPLKCSWGVNRLEFLGHVVENGQLLPDPKKVQAIKDMIPPTNVDELRSFLGLTGYVQKFVPFYPNVCAPLYQLLRKKVDWTWTTKEQLAFDTLREALMSEPVLSIFDPELETVLLTDASNYAIGAVLKQRKYADDGTFVELTVGYFSRTLKAAERNYCTTDRECLAIVEAILFFDHYLDKRKFTVITDHCALQYLARVKQAKSRLLRWALLLQCRDYTIEHRPGRKHCEPDCLSRLLPKFMADMGIKDELVELTREEVMSCSTSIAKKPSSSSTIIKTMVNDQTNFKSGPRWPIEKITRKESTENDAQLSLRIDAIKSAQEKDPFCNYIYSLFNSKELGPSDMQMLDQYVLLDGRIYRKLKAKKEKNIKTEDSSSSNTTTIKISEDEREMFRILVPVAYRSELLLSYHDKNGHPGQKTTVVDLRTKYYWPRMELDVVEYVRSCELCARQKDDKTGPAPMVSIGGHTPIELCPPFTRVAIDVVHVTTPGKYGHKYIVTCTCLTTKFSVAAYFSNQRVTTIVNFLERSVFLVYGHPKEITQDNGTNFRSELYQKVLDELQVRRQYTSGYRPQANSNVERLQGTLKQIIHLMVDDTGKNWVDMLPYATWAYNTHRHSITGYSPYYLVFGSQPKQLFDILQDVPNLVQRSIDEKNLSAADITARRLLNARLEAIRRIVKLGEQREVKANVHRKPTNYAPGDQVLVLKKVRPVGETTFTWTPYEDGYVVLRSHRENNYVIRHKNWPAERTELIHADRLRRSFARWTTNPDIIIPAITSTSRPDEVIETNGQQTNEKKVINTEKRGRQRKRPTYLDDYID